MVSRRARRWLAPEVVQTSGMDCGPAALKCLLEGHGIAVSYGRLREACQTTVDGTSIDTIEDVAGRLGLAAEQVMIPIDHILLKCAPLPALVVVRHADNATHFVVVWARHGDWLQLMDPALGRRWVRVSEFREQLFRHTLTVAAEDWRSWVTTGPCQAAWRDRLAKIGIGNAAADAQLNEILADPNWFAAGAFDAALRLVQSLIDAGGVRPGGEALGLLGALVRGTIARPNDIFATIPPAYWSVTPDVEASRSGRMMLTISGGVLLKVTGLRNPDQEQADQLSPELAAALAEQPTRPLRAIVDLLRQDGLWTPICLTGAAFVATGALMVEALLFRGMLDIGPSLAVAHQRLEGGIALVAFMGLLFAVDLVLGLELVRQGRSLELRLRMALLEKLPRLSDRYFQSRPVTDMADRSHNIHAVRAIPVLGLQFLQGLFELVLTAAALTLIAPDAAGLALLIALSSIALPFLMQPLVNERDLRVRNQAGALHGFYLDAILGLAPIRAHRAARAIRRQHESLLVEWAQSFGSLVRLSVLVDVAQAMLTTGLSVLLILRHFAWAEKVGGADLLLVFWALKLPAVGARVADLAHRYPAQRNTLMRLLEPLRAPDAVAATAIAPPDRSGPTSIVLDQVDVIAGGHSILCGISCTIRPGEHVAIVGPSGAGKSSLVGLLLGWHRAECGRLLVDGLDADPAAIEALRLRTAWLDPAIQIWNRSLLDNLLYAANDEAIADVGKITECADLREVIRKLPDGLQTLLGEGGGLLSGGEGQRVRLARALLTDKVRLALLDEPFRGLDRVQRRRLLAEARAWWSETTLLCVTHDIEETLAFDRVLVIEDGRIVEDGCPAELEASSSRYRDLLDAEARVHAQLWRDHGWRRLTVENGRIEEALANV